MLAAHLTREREACDFALAIGRIVENHVVADARRRKVSVRNLRTKEAAGCGLRLIVLETRSEFGADQLIKGLALRIARSPREPIEALEIEARPQFCKVHRINRRRTPEWRRRDIGELTLDR